MLNLLFRTAWPLMFWLLFYTVDASAVAKITPANTSISADTTSVAPGTGAYTAITGPTLTEGKTNDISSGTIILNAPSGFEFRTTANSVTVSVSCTGNAKSDLTLASPVATLSTTQISITVNTVGADPNKCTLTWNGIQARPTLPGATLSTGNITLDGNATINGASAGTNFGTLTEIAGAAKKLGFAQQPLDTVVNQAITPAVTVAIQDQFGNTVTSSTSKVTLALDANPAGGTLSGIKAVNAASGIASFSTLTINKVGSGYTLAATSTGLTGAVSNAFTIGYPVPVTTSISPVSKLAGEAPFNMTVYGSNFTPETVVRFNGSSRATTYISSTQLTASILGSDLAATGIFNIDAVNPAPGGGVSNAQIFNVLSPVSDFNAFESSTAATAIAGRIYTKLAGATFNLDVVAISNGAKSSSFSGNVKIELLANTGTPGSGYGTNNCPDSGSVIQAIASTTITSGRSTINFGAVSKAYRDVRVRISFLTSSPTLIACSTDSFTIRPLAFTITSTDATNTGKSGAPTIKAGDKFNLTATAIAGYNLAPKVDSSKVAGTNIAGVLSGSFAAAESTTGVAAGSFTYGEAGNFGLNSNAVYDTAFTSIDQGGDCTTDHSNTLDSNGKYGCYIGSYAVTQTTGSSGFGRFIPHHFDTAVTPGCAAGSFTYSGQPFTVKVTAKNSAGGITQNYNTACGYAKTITLSNAAGSAGNLNIGWPPPVTPIQTMASTQFTNPVACGGAMNPSDGPNGSQDNVTFKLPAPETAPVTITLRAVDADGVTSSSFTEGTTEVRSGRIKLSNAHGSELLPLPIPIAFQYYTSNGWVPNTADSCSIISASNFAFSSPGNNLAACETAITVSGSAPAYSLTLAAPGNSNNGWTGLTLNLGAEAAGSTCTAKNGGTGFSGLATTANMPWLQFPWGGAGATNPSARATFGVYKGGNEFIYLRERY